MKKALLFANGQVGQHEIGRIEAENFDVIVAADGGVRNALSVDRTPHYVIGDLDSIGSSLREQLGQTKFICLPSQELNDLEKSLQFCESLNITHITLLGISGKRLDHTLNNLSVLCRYDQRFHLTIYDPYSQIYLVRDVWEYTGREGQLISLIPLGRVGGITTVGLAFPLQEESLSFGYREGLSNYIVQNPVTLRIREGVLAVFVIYRKGEGGGQIGSGEMVTGHD